MKTRAQIALNEALDLFLFVYFAFVAIVAAVLIVESSCERERGSYREVRTTPTQSRMAYTA